MLWDMRKLAVTRLGYEFGDYLLTIAGRKCGHVRVTEPPVLPHALAQILGWEIMLADLATRLRCSSCNGKDCELIPNPRTRPRGKDFR